MRQPKFNFVPERQINSEPSSSGYYVTITKQKSLIFGSSDVRIYDLEGKHVRLFVDTEKKSIAWQVIEGKTGLDALNDARLMKKNATNGNVLLGIGRILKALGIDEVKENKKYAVKKYASLLHTGELWYISLNNEKGNEADIL